jgi:hypothetical protein
MLEVNFENIKYNRFLTNSVNSNTTIELKKLNDYSFIISYNGEFEDEEYEIVEKNACLIDLDLSSEDIVSGFNSTGRNEYRRTFRTLGLDFHFGFEDSQKYYDFYSRCEKARNWLPIPKPELENCLLFTASFQGEYISGMSCYKGENVLRVGRIYSTKRINTNKEINGTIYGGAAKRIVIEICNYAREKGFKYVDLGGVDLNSDEKSGISQFKLSLGGEIVPVKIGRFMKPGFIEKQKDIFLKGFDIT